MASLSNHDAKLLLLALRRQEQTQKAKDREEDQEYGGGGSLWDTVQIVPGSKADRLPPSLSAVTALAAGNVMLKITMAGGVVLCAASCVSMSLPWWQQPVARWYMRSYAIDWCWLTAASTGMYGAAEATGATEDYVPCPVTGFEEPQPTTVAASVAGGAAAGYLGTLAFITLL